MACSGRRAVVGNPVDLAGAGEQSIPVFAPGHPSPARLGRGRRRARYGVFRRLRRVRRRVRGHGDGDGTGDGTGCERNRTAACRADDVSPRACRCGPPGGRSAGLRRYRGRRCSARPARRARRAGADRRSRASSARGRCRSGRGILRSAGVPRRCRYPFHGRTPRRDARRGARGRSRDRAIPSS